MAVVLIEGWDNLTAAEIPVKGWSAFNLTTGRFGGQSASAANATARGKGLPSTYTTLFAGCAVQFGAALAGPLDLLILKNGGVSGTSAFRVGYDATGKLIVRNSGGTTIATGTTVLTSGVWYYIEFKAVINGASGSCEVHLNGATEISTTTGNFGSTAVDTLCLAGQTGPTLFDDIYCLDSTGSAPRNSFLGDVRVATIYPTADGAHSAWTPNSGSTHYTQVNEAQADGDTTYVADSTPGDIDSYTFGDIDTGATVYGVQTNLYARKDDASTRQIAPVIRQSGSDNVGTTVTLSSSYAFYTQIYNQDPTSADWTPTTVNADEFGVKEIA